MALADLLTFGRASVEKRSINAISAFLASNPKASDVSELLKMILQEHSSSQLMLLIHICAIAPEAVRQRQVEVEAILGQEEDMLTTDLSVLAALGQLNTPESGTRLSSSSINLISRNIGHDPNYGSGEDDFEDFSDYEDTEDESWRVRKTALKALQANMASLLPQDRSRMAGILQDRLLDRVESVQIDVIKTLTTLVYAQQGGLEASHRKRKSPDMDEDGVVDRITILNAASKIVANKQYLVLPALYELLVATRVDELPKDLLQPILDLRSDADAKLGIPMLELFGRIFRSVTVDEIKKVCMAALRHSDSGVRLRAIGIPLVAYRRGDFLDAAYEIYSSISQNMETPIRIEQLKALTSMPAQSDAHVRILTTVLDQALVNENTQFVALQCLEKHSQSALIDYALSQVRHLISALRATSTAVRNMSELILSHLPLSEQALADILDLRPASYNEDLSRALSVLLAMPKYSHSLTDKLMTYLDLQDVNEECANKLRDLARKIGTIPQTMSTHNKFLISTMIGETLRTNQIEFEDCVGRIARGGPSTSDLGVVAQSTFVDEGVFSTLWAARNSHDKQEIIYTIANLILHDLPGSIAILQECMLEDAAFCLAILDKAADIAKKRLVDVAPMWDLVASQTSFPVTGTILAKSSNGNLAKIATLAETDTVEARRTALYALLYASTQSTFAKKPIIELCIKYLNDTEIKSVHLAVDTIRSALQHAKEMDNEVIVQVLQAFHSVALVRKELIREVMVGPFKHLVDDGLDTRAALHETVHRLISGTLIKLSMDFARHNAALFVRIGMQGLADAHDVQGFAAMTLIRVCEVNARHVQENLAEICALLKPLLVDEVVKEGEGVKNIDKSAVLRLVAALADLSPDSNVTELVKMVQQNEKWNEIYRKIA